MAAKLTGHGDVHVELDGEGLVTLKRNGILLELSESRLGDNTQIIFVHISERKLRDSLKKLWIISEKHLQALRQQIIRTKTENIAPCPNIAGDKVAGNKIIAKPIGTFEKTGLAGSFLIVSTQITDLIICAAVHDGENGSVFQHGFMPVFDEPMDKVNGAGVGDLVFGFIACPAYPLDLLHGGQQVVAVDDLIGRFNDFHNGWFLSLDRWSG